MADGTPMTQHDTTGAPEPAAPGLRQWKADDCTCNEVDDCYGDPDQETPPDSPWSRFCPYCHYVGGLCPGREERAS